MRKEVMRVSTWVVGRGFIKWAMVVLAVCSTACEADRAPAQTTIELGTSVSLASVSEVANVRDVFPFGGDQVWILNERGPFLILQNQDGVHATFGQPGEGPDELSSPWVILGGSDNQVTVWDFGRRSVRTFGVDGMEMQSRPAPPSSQVMVPVLEQSFGDPLKTVRQDDHIVTSRYPAGLTNPRGLWNRSIARINLTNLNEEILFDFAPEESRFERQLGEAMSLMPIPLWAACADGSVAAFMPFTDSILWRGADRSDIELSIGPEPALHRDDIERYVRGVMRVAAGSELGRSMSDVEIDERLREVMPLMEQAASDVAPRYVGMMCDESSRIWLQRFSTVDHWTGEGRDWDIIEEGEVLATVRLPDRFRPYVFANESLVGVQRDELDVQSVAFVSLSEVP